MKRAAGKAPVRKRRDPDGRRREKDARDIPACMPVSSGRLMRPDGSWDPMLLWKLDGGYLGRSLDGGPFYYLTSAWPDTRSGTGSPAAAGMGTGPETGRRAKSRK